MAAANKTVYYSTEGGDYDDAGHDPFWRWMNEDYQLDRGEDKPAIICTSGRHEWWQGGKQHRVGKPALTLKDGSYVYYFRGVRHNLKGPASFNASNGETKYFIQGTKYATLEDFLDARDAYCKEHNIPIPKEDESRDP